MIVQIKDAELKNVAALKIGMEQLVNKYSCQAIAIQCWNALQSELGIMPCAANALLNDQGIPVACETDVHGAITALLVEAAALKTKRFLFADWTIRHPDIPNGELLQHCGPWPVSVSKEKPLLTYPLALIFLEALQQRQSTVLFLYVVLTATMVNILSLIRPCKGVEGPLCKGTYLWIEVENIKRLEEN